MANVNKNPAQGRTGGSSIRSTGAPDQREQPDSQKGDAANAVGDKDHVEPGAPDEQSKGGKQPTDPVQNEAKV